MRSPAIAGLGVILCLAAMGDAVAAPVELVCTIGGSAETHLYIDLDARKVTWFGQSFQAQITDTQVRWSGTAAVSQSGNGPDIDAVLDRDTGTLVVSQEGGTDPSTGISWAHARTTYACVKAQKIL